MDVATSDEGQAEATAQATSAAETETADTGASVKETSDSTAKADDDLADFTADLTQVPEGLRPHVEKFAKKYELDFKRSYTRKTQELSAKEKAREAELADYKTKAFELERIAREVLEDPAKLDAYRKLYGMQQQPQAEQMPKIETVGDLTNFYEKKLQATQQEVERRMEQKMQATLAQKDMVSRWEGAAEVLKQTDPKFAKYEKVVANIMLTDPKYKQMYNGRNERDVYKAAYDEVKSMIREELDEVKKQTLDTVKQKKQASTSVPQKTVSTTSAGGKLDKAAIIARVQARLGG